MYRGQTLGIIGRNGSGKSTLLRTLAGILSPDKGTIENFGVSVSLMSLQLGFTDTLNGWDNAVMSGLILGMTRRQITRHLDEIAEFSDLGDFMDQPLGTYSSGMKVRLGFSVALFLDADVLLLDEVLSVGDAQFREKSATALRDIMASDRTVVIVSHNPSTIEQLCDRAIWIEKGATRMEGEVKRVLESYQECVLGHPGSH